jgi:hypothetical protein
MTWGRSRHLHPHGPPSMSAHSCDHTEAGVLSVPTNICVICAHLATSCISYENVNKIIYSCSFLQPVENQPTSVDFQRTTRRHIAEDNHRCENLKILYNNTVLLATINIINRQH